MIHTILYYGRFSLNFERLQEMGDTFTIYKEEEALTDPITGAPLGAEKSKIAEVRINEVKEKYSKAVILEARGNIERGDLVMCE